MVNYTLIVKKLLKEMFKRVGLEYHEDYCKKADWYLTKSWTEEEQKEFKLWGERVLKADLKMTDCGAAREMGWFLLSYGWTTGPENEDKD